MKRNVGWIVVVSLTVLVGGCASTPKNQPDTSEISEAVAAPDSQSFTLNLDERGRGLRGYDPVAYFKRDQAVEGKEAYTVSWQGADWYFSSADNREEFSQNPEKYAPANGGYCTFGIVLSKKFDGDPTVWSIVEDQLYVFLNEEVREKFLQDTAGNLQTVSVNWPQIKNKSPEEL